MVNKIILEEWLSGLRHLLGKQAESAMAPKGSNPFSSANFYGIVVEWFTHNVKGVAPARG